MWPCHNKCFLSCFYFVCPMCFNFVHLKTFLEGGIFYFTQLPKEYMGYKNAKKPELEREKFLHTLIMVTQQRSQVTLPTLFHSWRQSGCQELKEHPQVTGTQESHSQGQPYSIYLLAPVRSSAYTLTITIIITFLPLNGGRHYLSKWI